MDKRVNAIVALAAALSASSCAMLEPKLPTAQPSIAGEWPLPATTTATQAGSAAPAAAVADIGWREFFADPKLEELIGRALANNRDLRVAVLNVERARAQYHVQRADRVPSLGVNGTMVRSGGDALRTTEAYSVGLGVTEFELDLFGRVRNLSQSALETLFLAGGGAPQRPAQPDRGGRQRLPDARRRPGAVAPCAGDAPDPRGIPRADGKAP